MIHPTRVNLLIVGIVTQHAAAQSTCTAYTVAHGLNLSHVTARKILVELKEAGLLNAQASLTPANFYRVRYTVTSAGLVWLHHHKDLFMEMYLSFLFSMFEVF